MRINVTHTQPLLAQLVCCVLRFVYACYIQTLRGLGCALRIVYAYCVCLLHRRILGSGRVFRIAYAYGV